MLEIGLKAGDIFTWENYPLQMDKIKPRRWFLYLGNQTQEVVVYQITTTTQYEHYNEGGNRTKNNYFKIPAGMGGLEKESILDLSLFEAVHESLFNRFKSDIAKTGSLNQDYINKFIKHLKNDKKIVTRIKNDIYGYLRDAGFKVS